MSQATLQAFSQDQFELANQLLSAKVATMLGRKMEEGDWDFVYCNAKKIPITDWSNLHIDVIHNGLGVEHKMLAYRRNRSIKNVCGTTLMHPSATRSIRINDINADPNEACKDILNQYGELIQQRTDMVKEKSGTQGADMRTGWLIWKDSLEEFLYFEVRMEIPNHENYYAEWNETPARGARKSTKSLWIYEKDTNKKRYSVTTTAGAKIQPYFDVPSPNDNNLYYFKVQGVIQDGGLIKVWITKSTAKYLEAILGNLEAENISKAILNLKVNEVKEPKSDYVNPRDIAIPILIKKEAYDHLKSSFEYVSDEYIFQQFALNL